MGRPKLSDWQDGNTKPTEIGVYQRKDSWGDIGWSYWHGPYWNSVEYSKEEALTDRDHPFNSYYQELPWRGINESLHPNVQKT
jgi:hypothetical protein